MEAYYQVFIKRYHELKEKERIDLKLQHAAFNKLTKQSIEEFDAQKSYVLLLQDDDYNNKKTYMQLIAKA